MDYLYHKNTSFSLTIGKKSCQKQNKRIFLLPTNEPHIEIKALPISNEVNKELTKAYPFKIFPKNKRR
jgi:hypothetical protein